MIQRKFVHLQLGTCLPWGFASASPAVQKILHKNNTRVTLTRSKKHAVYRYNSHSFDLVAAIVILPSKTNIYTYTLEKSMVGRCLKNFLLKTASLSWERKKNPSFSGGKIRVPQKHIHPHHMIFSGPREYPKLHPGEIQILQLYPSANSTSPVPSNRRKNPVDKTLVGQPRFHRTNHPNCLKENHRNLKLLTSVTLGSMLIFRGVTVGTVEIGLIGCNTEAQHLISEPLSLKCSISNCISP